MEAERNIKLPSQVWSQLADLALAEGKTVEQVFEEAAKDLLLRRGLRRLVAENQRAAAERGLTEEDVPRLVRESRSEQRGR